MIIMYVIILFLCYYVSIDVLFCPGYFSFFLILLDPGGPFMSRFEFWASSLFRYVFDYFIESLSRFVFNCYPC